MTTVRDRAGVRPMLAEARAIGVPGVYLVAAAAVSIDGLNWPIMARGIELVPPLWLASLRLAGSALVAGSMLAATGRLRRPTRADRSILLSVGVGRLAFVTGATFVALRYVPPGRSSILAYTASLWAAPMALLVLHERLTALRLAGLALGGAGIVCILEPWSLDLGEARTLIGFALLLGSAIATAATAVHIRAHRWSRSPLELMPWQLAIGALPLGVLAITSEGVPRIAWTAPAVAIVGYQIVFSSVFALWGAMTLIRSVPAITSNLILMAVPVVGLASSVWLVHDPVSAPLIAGLLLVLGGVGLGLRSDRRVANPLVPTPWARTSRRAVRRPDGSDRMRDASCRKGETNVLRHVAMFRFKEDATEEQREASRSALQGLKGQVPTLREMTVGRDIRRNPNNWDMVLVADFDDQDGLEAYFAHPVMNAASDLTASVTQKEITARVQFLY